jgi:uncharacterized protein (TIGR02147 family)
MVDLFVYTDYRKYLRDFFGERRQSKAFLSLRYYAGKLGLDPGNFVKILNAERHLSPKALPKAIEFLKFSEREAEYFRTLVAFGKAKNQSDIRRLFERLASMKRIEPFEITSAVAEFYRRWYHTAIAGLLSFHDFDNDYDALAKQLVPAITAKQARESVALLKAIGMVAKNADGLLKPVHELITTGDKWHASAIHEYQRETIRLAENAIDELPKAVRDVSTVSFAVNQEDFKEICSLAKDFRTSVMRIARESENADRLYQMNIQVFPLTQGKQ